MGSNISDLDGEEYNQAIECRRLLLLAGADPTLEGTNLDSYLHEALGDLKSVGTRFSNVKQLLLMMKGISTWCTGPWRAAH